MPCSRLPSANPPIKSSPVQPSQALGCSFSPFLADLSGVGLGGLSTVRYAGRTPCHNIGARRWPATVAKECPMSKEVSPSRLGAANAAVKPTLGMLSHSLQRDFTSPARKVSGSCRCRKSSLPDGPEEKVAKENENCPCPVLLRS